MILIDQIKQHDEILAKQQKIFEEQLRSQQQVINLLQNQLSKITVNGNINNHNQKPNPYGHYEAQKLDSSIHTRNTQNESSLHTPIIKAQYYNTEDTGKKQYLSSTISKDQHKVSLLYMDHKTYLDERHKQSQDRISLLRQQKREQELTELKKRPPQTLKSKSSRNGYQDRMTRSLDRERGTSSYSRQIEKNKEKSLSQKRGMIMIEKGVNFTPRISKKSQSLERNVNDLLDWEKSKKQKIQLTAQENIKVQEQSLQKTIQLCPGTLKIMNQMRKNSQEIEQVGERLYQNGRESLIRKQEQVMKANKLKLKQMKPQITPKGKKSQAIFMDKGNKCSNKKPKIPKGGKHGGKYLKSKGRKSSQEQMREKLNMFIQTKYQLSNQKTQNHTEIKLSRNHDTPNKILLQTCSPTFETDISIKHFQNLEQVKKIETRQSLASTGGREALKQLQANPNLNQDAINKYLDQRLQLIDHGNNDHSYQEQSHFSKIQCSASPTISTPKNQNQSRPSFPLTEITSGHQNIAQVQAPHPQFKQETNPYYQQLGMLQNQYQMQVNGQFIGLPQQILPMGHGFYPYQYNQQMQNGQMMQNPQYTAQQMQQPVSSMLTQEMILQQIELIKQNIIKNEQIQQLEQQKRQQLQQQQNLNVNHRPSFSSSNNGDVISSKRMDSRLSLDEEEDLFKYSIDDQLSSNHNLLLISNNNSHR
ncbi:UNKNOWN [Stylonychia lemnae]|uniref:Uncharacterized protein n=1 Tax=Stylonychia lemnae TaxID=5949 RepID=A0A078AH66_STYLE|nr:UNKNOWN [Stylonychia lemnae]|eukprot:CDW80857.1 UNKNOWN [Stylonychia lemnae]